MTDFGIDKAFEVLGLQEINEGTSTGSLNFSNGEVIESYSPVDGKLIGKESFESFKKKLNEVPSGFEPL